MADNPTIADPTAAMSQGDGDESNKGYESIDVNPVCSHFEQVQADHRQKYRAALDEYEKSQDHYDAMFIVWDQGRAKYQEADSMFLREHVRLEDAQREQASKVSCLEQAQRHCNEFLITTTHAIQRVEEEIDHFKDAREAEFEQGDDEDEGFVNGDYEVTSRALVSSIANLHDFTAECIPLFLDAQAAGRDLITSRTIVEQVATAFAAANHALEQECIEHERRFDDLVRARERYDRAQHGLMLVMREYKQTIDSLCMMEDLEQNRATE